jgi:microcystin-dependent protein
VADPFLGEIRAVPFTFPPNGWALCNGQLLPISQNTALFSLLGTTYGGDGRTTFALPNLQGSAPLHAGQGGGLSLRDLGQAGGEPAVTLTSGEITTHSHTLGVRNGTGDRNSPSGNALAGARSGRQPAPRYSATPGSAPPMSPQALALAGGGQPHDNMPPYLVLNFIIALQGVFPSRS